MFETMLQDIQKAVPPRAKVAEFYAGVAAIGLSLASQAGQVCCSDINAAGLYCFQQSQSRLSKEVAARISWLAGSAQELVLMLDKNDIAIVDPPRKGLDKAFKLALAKSGRLKHFIYISCGFDSLQRDCLELMNAGWDLKSAQLYLFFPGSNHIETMLVFERA